MINKDSIVTAYDEHLTLVEWLQKVETALNNAVLTNLGIAKLNDKDNVATYQVTATFADNTTIVSDTFTLPSTGIVTAFSNLTTLVNGFDTRITTNTNNVASILNIIDIANDKIKAYTLQNSINGSDGIIVGVDATSKKLEIHLSAELQAKLGKMLLTPSSAPSTRKVVTIDTNGAQDNVDGTELTTLMSNIVDSHGNKRFVEGTGTLPAIEGLTITYNKWSLSGTHLMLVLCGSIAKNTNLNTGNTIVNYNLPQWVLDKIVPVFANSAIEVIPLSLRANDYTEQKVNLIIGKTADGVYATLGDAITLNAGRNFRFQYDLLIDSE